MGMTAERAYKECRAIAKREAKNFYYAFAVLPRHKSDAICAVYAFMRKADDLSDDESLSLETRREAMKRWREAWREARHGDTDDPVFSALNDAQQRFGIPDRLLEQLVEGTTMDLYQEPGAVQTFADFKQLYHYCYLVASVVGLVCIRIFGYTDPEAERLAEETGIAFQLTNILRDVKEDAERGRIYLPQELLWEHDVSAERVGELAAGAEPSADELEMLDEVSSRAWNFYGSAHALAPLLDKDSRAAFEVLVDIYSGLLRRIDASRGESLHQRVSVPTMVKLGYLLRGLLMSLWNRVTA
jgi:phytoene synthase